MPADSARGCKASSGAKRAETVAQSRGSMNTGDVLGAHRVYVGSGVWCSPAGGQGCRGAGRDRIGKKDSCMLGGSEG